MDTQALDRDGYLVLPAFLPKDLLERLDAVTRVLPPASDTRRGGLRNPVEALPGLGSLVRDPLVSDTAGAALASPAFLVRAILFDKTAEANWRVPWHQDTTIAVRRRLGVPGFGPWSVKDGVPHCQPPAAVLERMVTLRVHIDPCPADNGPLWVLPGTHSEGFLDDARIDALAASRSPAACVTPAGGAVLMRPLLLHASPKAESPCRRRVLHLEFASDGLPGGLQWACSRPSVVLGSREASTVTDPGFDERKASTPADQQPANQALRKAKMSATWIPFC